MMHGLPLCWLPSILNKRSKLRRALDGSMLAHDEKHVFSRELEVPAGGGVGTARALARAYSEFANRGERLELRERTLWELEAPATAPKRGFYDEVLKVETRFSLGFMKGSPGFPLGGFGSYGAPGA